MTLWTPQGQSRAQRESSEMDLVKATNADVIRHRWCSQFLSCQLSHEAGPAEGESQPACTLHCCTAHTEFHFTLSDNKHPDPVLLHSCAPDFICHLTNALALVHAAPSKVKVPFLVLAERGSGSSLRGDSRKQTWTFPQIRRRLQI